LNFTTVEYSDFQQDDSGAFALQLTNS